MKLSYWGIDDTSYIYYNKYNKYLIVMFYSFYRILSIFIFYSSEFRNILILVIKIKPLGIYKTEGI